MSLSNRTKTNVKVEEKIEIKKTVPIIEKKVVEKIVPITRKYIEKVIVGEKEEIEIKTKIRNKKITTITHKDIEFKDKKYTICYTSFNDEDILFVIDFNKKEQVIYKKWHKVNSGDYIANTYYEDDEYKMKRDLYLHNLIMNKLTFDGKGQHHSIDHINRIGRDNRKENLRELTQSHQNINQKKKERNIELPADCGINPQDIPKNIYYRKPEGLHGDRFYIDIKLTENPFRWYSTSSKNIDLKTKLQHAILKLKEFKTNNPEYAEILDIIDNVKQRNELIVSFNVILMKSGFPQQIIDKNLAPLEKVPEEKINVEAENLAKQLIDIGLKGVKTSLPADCGVTQEMIPKHCYYKPETEKRGGKFIIERHPVLVAKGVRQWATTESKSKTIKEKFNLLMEKYNDLEK